MSKNVIIFGASSGIGKELAKLMVSENYKVAITGRRIDKLNEIKAESPENYVIKQHDVTDIKSTDIIFKELTDDMGKVDIVVYCSGVGGPNYELDWAKEQTTISTNVIGATKIFGLAYNFFKNQGYGQLVCISSIAGIRGNRHVPGYFASKAYQNSYLESLWMKSQRTRADIVITDIVPGFVETKMATGNTFWKAPLAKATSQIFKAIKMKRKKAYITKRWRFIAIFLRLAPAKLVMKYL
jgi:short-subunit dehydrogenase